jgi:hypothetical protein
MYNGDGASVNVSGDCWTGSYLTVLVNPTPTAGKIMAGVKTLMIPTPDKEADRQKFIEFTENLPHNRTENELLSSILSNIDVRTIVGAFA